MKIDLNRGVTIRRHPTSGTQVYMYKDTPGEFLNAHGTEVDPAFAEACGFDTTVLLKDKLKRERMAVAMATIEAEFGSSPATMETIREQKGFKLVAVGLGRHKVLDPNGEELHERPLTLEEGEVLLDQLTGTQVEQPTEDVQKEQTVPLIEDKPEPGSKAYHLATKPATPVYPKPPLAHVIPTDKDKLAQTAKAAKSPSKKN